MTYSHNNEYKILCGYSRHLTLKQSARLPQNPSHFSTAMCDAAFSHKSHIISTTPGNVSKQVLLPIKGCAIMSQAVSVCWHLDRRPGHVGCMTGNKALGQLRYFSKFIFPLSVIIP